MKKNEGSLAFMVIVLLLVIAVPVLYSQRAETSATGAAVVKSISTTFTANIAISIAVIIAIAIIVILLLVWNRKRKFKKTEHSKIAQVKKTDEQLLESYVQQAHDAGKSMHAVKHTLLTHGWGKLIVQDVVHRVYTGYDLPLPKQTIEAFVRNAAIRGTSRDEIINVMKKKGWAEKSVKKEVDEVLWKHRKQLKKKESAQPNILERELPELNKHITSLKDADTPYFEDADDCNDADSNEAEDLNS
jgi:type IV secretory pathway VirB2 component (pilin)